MSTPKPPEAAVLIGIQATGKSSFVRQRMFDTHVRINLDMLRTRHREAQLLDACLRTGQSFVIDNTNPSRDDRARYISPARAAGFAITGYYFQSAIAAALHRNEQREGAARIADAGILSTHARLELPQLHEGFDALFYVALSPGGFEVQEWRDEV